MDSEPRRLHRLSWLFLTVNFAKSLILPLIFVLFASGSNPWARFELFGAVFIIPILAGAVIHQRVFNYRFGEEELTVREGILTRKQRNIPYNRIHNIAVVRNPLHRLLGVASVRIETAGGGKPEAVLRVLDLQAVAELRRETLPETAADPDRDLAAESDAPLPPMTDSQLLTVSPTELAKLGLVTGPGLVIAAVAGSLYQFQWWEFDWWKSSSLARGDFPNWLEPILRSGSIGGRILIGLAVILLIVALLRLASVLWHLTKYWGFTLFRDGDDLRAEYGLLTRVSSVIPPHRIQLVTVRASLPHRWLGRASIELESAGSSEEDSDLSAQIGASGSTRRQLLAPMLDETRVSSFLRSVLPDIDLDLVKWQGLSPRARHRILSRTIKITGLVTLSLGLLFGFTPLPIDPLHALWIPLVVLPLTYLATTGWLGYSAWGLSRGAIFFRSGWLKRSITVVPLSRVQSTTVTASYFDRRRNMASVAVDTAGAGALGHRIDVPYLDTAVAESILQDLYEAAGSIEFDW